jgi:hypothetical protein
MRSKFTIQPLLNKSEARVFRELDNVVIGCNSSWQVMAQVSLGEILRSADPDAYRCINSKRVDLLLVDSNCRPRHVIEYQGGAHHQGAAAARDAVKRRAGGGQKSATEEVTGRQTGAGVAAKGSAPLQRAAVSAWRLSTMLEECGADRGGGIP